MHLPLSPAAATSPAKATGADGANAPLFVSFTLQAHPEPGVMPRVVELFAKRGLVPQSWQSRVAGPLLTIDVTVAGLGRELCEYIARCMRQIVGVETVLTSETRFPG